MRILLNTNSPINLHDNASTTVLYHEDLALFDIGRNEFHDFYENPNVVCILLGEAFSIKENVKNSAQMLFNEYGKGQLIVDDFEGKFLFIVYDKKTRKLAIFSDSLGLQHAYYTVTSDGFILSTSIDEILRLTNDLTIDMHALDLYLTFQYVPHPYTMFDKIYQMPLHSSIKFQEKTVTIVPNETRIPSSNEGEVFSTQSSIGSDMQRILVDSFKRQIPENSSKVGAFLSGGMDTSSNIALLASKLDIKPIVFTAGFKEATYDETPFAEIMAKKYGLKHQILTITEDVISSLPQISALYDNPVADRAILPEYIICNEAKKEGILYMVSGEGGDEVLGYPRNLPEDDIFNAHISNNNQEVADYYYAASALMQKDMRMKLLQKNSDALGKQDYLAELYKQFGNVSSFEKIYYGQWQTWLIDNVLMKDLQLFQQSGFKFVSPYISKKLMIYMHSLPIEEKVDGLRNKKFLKQALGDLLPDTIINKTKHKFHVPITEWFRGESYEFVRESLLASDSFCRQYLNIKVIEELLTMHKSGKADYNRPLWALFFLEQWYRNKKGLVSHRG